MCIRDSCQIVHLCHDLCTTCHHLPLCSRCDFFALHKLNMLNFFISMRNPAFRKYRIKSVFNLHKVIFRLLPNNFNVVTSFYTCFVSSDNALFLTRDFSELPCTLVVRVNFNFYIFLTSSFESYVSAHVSWVIIVNIQVILQ